MSSNYAASAALAASAAFKGSSQTPTQKRNTKPPLRLAINTDVNGSKTSLAAAQMSQQRSQKLATPTASRPAKSPIGPLGVVKPQPRRTSGGSDDDASSMILVGTDYFSISRADGSNGTSDLAVGTPYRLRTSISTKPHDMLEQVRQSINSKSKVGVGKDLNRKSQLAIDQVRQSVEQHRQNVDQNRNRSHGEVSINSDAQSTRSAAPTSSLTPNGDSDRLSMISGQGLGSFYNQSFLNNSHSSVGTGTSNDFDGPVTPIIRVEKSPSIENEAAKALSGSLSPSPAINSGRNVSATSLPFAPPSPAPSPIAIPPSPHALARSMASESQIPLLSLLPSVAASSAELDEPKKAHRKPPPAEIYSDDEGSLSGHSVLAPASDAEEVEEHKLPIFPEIGEKQKKHKGLFRRKHKEPAYVHSLMDDEDKEEDFIPSRSATPVVNTQQVKFKTTMRKTSKKTTFNEDKPWKNHSELDYVSEQQRKRYEGLWVSNRGLYMNKVVSRLVGVNYEKEEAESEGEAKDKKLSVKEISEKAAKLSSAATSDPQEYDIQHLHSLTEAEAHELIHGVVVKRLWSRSRLSEEELASIWELVDFRKDGTLNKAEFIVGMWLVDQRLYGRKLSKEVPELVWTSLGSIGVRVVIKKKRR